MTRILIIGFFIISLSSCIITPNYDSEWTFPEIKGYLVDSLTNSPIANVIIFAEYDDTVQSDNNGFFNFKAKKEYIKYRVTAMDPPKPNIDLRFEKGGYSIRKMSIKYIIIDYNRVKPDTIDLKTITMIKNLP